jgi:hypothetical protein
MSTQAQLVASLRRRLNDPESKRWTDLELVDYLDEAVNKYSKEFPRLREVTFTPDGISNRYDVPEDLLDQWIHNIWIILPSGRKYEVPGGILRLREPERSFEVVGQELVLNFVPPPDNIIMMRYSALYSVPTEGNSLLPKEDENLVFIWAEHLAWRKIAGQDASLSRWTDDRKRDDSPLIPQHRWLHDEWFREVKEKKSQSGGFLQRVRAPRYGRFAYTDG